MLPPRRRPRIAPTGRVTVRLTPAQRDLFTQPAIVPKDLAHVLRRAHVTEGKLTVRLDRKSLDALIVAAATVPVPDRSAERAVATLLRYLESIEDRFDDDGEDAGG